MASVMQSLGLTGAAMAVVAALGAGYDMAQHRIPNWLTVGGLVLGLALRVPGGWEALGPGLAGAGVCLLLSLPLFLVGGAGGGDVKFLAALGAFLGLDRVPEALFVMAMVGGLMAVVAILRRGSVAEVTANLRTILSTFGRKTFTGWKGEESEAALTIETPGALTVPYGVAIAAGALAGWFL